MGKVYPPNELQSTHKYGDNRPSLWERYAVRALAAAVVGKDYRRHIHRAKVAARRKEAEADERQERAIRREQINRAVERSPEIRRRAARI